MSVSKKVLIGSLYVVSGRLLINIIGFISTLILARLLTPNDFGVVAMVMIFYAFLEVFSAVGVDTYLISKKDLSTKDFDSAWTINFILYALLGTVFYFSRFSIAEFYDKEVLVSVIEYICIMFVLSGLQNIAIVEYRKNLDFKYDLILQVIPKVIAVSVTITMALLIKSYWALVIGMLVSKAAFVVMTYIYHPYRPKFSLVNAIAIVHYSKWLLANNILFFINNRFVEMLVGKMYSSHSLGVFNIGKEMGELPSTQLAAAINRASLSGYSSVKADISTLFTLYIKSIVFISFICIPAGVGLSVLSEYFVLIILGEQWKEAIFIIQILALSSILSAINGNTGYIYLAIGKPKVTTMLTLARVGMLIPTLLFISVNYGFVYLSIGILIVSLIQFVIAQNIAARLLNVSLLKEILPTYIIPTISSLLMFIVLFILKGRFEIEVINFLWLIILGALVYAVCFYSLLRLLKIDFDIYNSVLGVVLSKLRRKS
jgi:O-antigen/teichoic acid export membrane protein